LSKKFLMLHTSSKPERFCFFMEKPVNPVTAVPSSKAAPTAGRVQAFCNIR